MEKKSPPRFPDIRLQRAFDQLYNDLNEVIENLGKYQTSLVDHAEGAIGSVRVSKQRDDSYIVSIKTEEGWINSSPTAFTFQKKTE